MDGEEVGVYQPDEIVECDVCCLSEQKSENNGLQAHTCLSFVIRVMKEIVGVGTFSEALERVRKQLETREVASNGDNIATRSVTTVANDGED